jgi:hypothetical protein
LRDPLPDGERPLLLIDWDSLDRDVREEYLARLLSHPGDRRIGLHSYHLPDAETIRRKGVVVFTRLEPDAMVLQPAAASKAAPSVRVAAGRG